MPKTDTPLSSVAVRNLRSAGKYYVQNGLFLRIEPTGSRRWVQRLTVPPIEVLVQTHMSLFRFRCARVGYLLQPF